MTLVFAQPAEWILLLKTNCFDGKKQKFGTDKGEQYLVSDIVNLKDLW